MRGLRLIAGSIALMNIIASLIILPRANEASQHWFDTGEPYTTAEKIMQPASVILATPFALWTEFFNPARINTFVFILSVIVNGSFWGLCSYLLLKRLTRRRPYLA
jgi:hypothetical protein